jgi:hypothetical protein
MPTLHNESNKSKKQTVTLVPIPATFNWTTVSQFAASKPWKLRIIIFRSCVHFLSLKHLKARYLVFLHRVLRNLSCHPLNDR